MVAHSSPVARFSAYSLQSGRDTRFSIASAESHQVCQVMRLTKYEVLSWSVVVLLLLYS
jgi:hypothetical protein